MGHYKTSVVEKVKEKDDGWGVREIGRRIFRGWEMTETTCKKCPLHLILEPISLRSDDMPFHVRHCVTCGPDEGDSAKYDLNLKVLVQIKQKLEEEKMKTAASETARLKAEEKSCNVIKTILEEKNKAEEKKKFEEMKKAEEKKHSSQALQIAQQGNYFDFGNGFRADIDTYVSSDEGTRNSSSVLTESSRIVFGSVVEHLESAKDKLNSSDSIQDQLEMATLIEKLASAAAAIKKIDN